MIFKKQHFIFISFFIFFACNEDPKTAFTEINITSNDNNLVEANIPNAIGDTIITNIINSEINTVVMTALQVGESTVTDSKTIEESIKLFNEEYKSFNKDFPDSSMPWEAQIDGELLFESSKLISVSITSYVNTGGAHGNTSITFLNFDGQTGKRLKNKDLLKDEEGFKKLAQSYLKTTLKEDDVLFDDDLFKLPENMAYTDNGVVLLYNTYEIAPYSTGIIEFTIPFDEIDSFLVFDGSK